MVVVAEQEYVRLEEQAHQFSLAAVIHVLDCLQDCLERMFRGGNRRVEMEMTMVRLCTPGLDTSTDALLRRVQALETALKTGVAPTGHVPAVVPVQPSGAAEEDISRMEAEEGLAVKKAEEELPLSGQTEPLSCWPEILEALHATSPSLCSFLDNSVAYRSGKYVLIDAPNSMAFEVLRKSPNQIEKMRAAITKVTGKVYRLGPYKAQSAEESSSMAEDPLMALMTKAEEAGIKTSLHSSDKK